MKLAGELPWLRTVAALTGTAGALVLIDGPDDAVSKLATAGQLVRRAVEDHHQALFVLARLDRPWLARVGYAVYDDAKAREQQHFGRGDHLDDDGDAFRHAWAAALMALRAMRDHGMSRPDAARLVIGLGDAHERDGADNAALSAQMDRVNNRRGVELVGSGRAGAGWISEFELEQHVLDAVRGGRLARVAADGGSLVATGPGRAATVVAAGP